MMFFEVVLVLLLALFLQFDMSTVGSGYYNVLRTELKVSYLTKRKN